MNKNKYVNANVNANVNIIGELVGEISSMRHYPNKTKMVEDISSTSSDYV